MLTLDRALGPRLRPLAARPITSGRPWPGGAELTYGHDSARDPLPRRRRGGGVRGRRAPRRRAGGAAATWSRRSTRWSLSFPNPRYHGSHHNPHHVNDWTLEQLEAELKRAALTRYGQLKVAHMYQPYGKPTIAYGRDPEAPFWIVVCKGEGKPARPGNGFDKARGLNLPR